MKSILLARVALSKTGKIALTTKIKLGGKIILGVQNHAALIYKNAGKLITGSLTHKKKIEKYAEAYKEEAAYSGELKSHYIDKIDYKGVADTQYVTSPGIRWPEEYINITETSPLKIYLEKHSKTFERFIEAQKELIETKKSGLIEISKLVENQSDNVVEILNIINN